MVKTYVFLVDPDLCEGKKKREISSEIIRNDLEKCGIDILDWKERYEWFGDLITVVADYGMNYIKTKLSRFKKTTSGHYYVIREWVVS